MQRDHMRIIDASANRAREGLRVLEDAARFLVDDAELSARLKDARHGLASALDGVLDRAVLVRDTQGDVGTGVSTQSEMRREDARGVVRAAGMRVGEALRSIEEWLKLEDADASARVERVRYGVYDIERDLVIALGSGKEVGWKLVVLVTESMCAHHSWEAVAQLALEGGADCLQLREKTMDGGELVSRARRLMGMAKDFGASVIVNDRADVCVAAGADGVHVGQRDLSALEARRIVGPDRIVGVSTTSIEQALRAKCDGADYCGVGPIFETRTKDAPGGRTDGSLAGPAFLREYLAHEGLRYPVAIGGIDAQNIEAGGLAGIEGSFGVAVSSAVCGAVDPKGVCEAMVSALTEQIDVAEAGA